MWYEEKQKDPSKSIGELYEKYLHPPKKIKRVPLVRYCRQVQKVAYKSLDID